MNMTDFGKKSKASLRRTCAGPRSGGVRRRQRALWCCGGLPDTQPVGGGDAVEVATLAVNQGAQGVVDRRIQMERQGGRSH